jgi:hypothetical protein
MEVVSHLEGARGQGQRREKKRKGGRPAMTTARGRCGKKRKGTSKSARTKRSRSNDDNDEPQPCNGWLALENLGDDGSRAGPISGAIVPKGSWALHFTTLFYLYIYIYIFYKFTKMFMSSKVLENYTSAAIGSGGRVPTAVVYSVRHLSVYHHLMAVRIPPASDYYRSPNGGSDHNVIKKSNFLYKFGWRLFI